MDDDLLRKFQQDGFVVLENFLSEKEVENLKQAGEELVDSMPQDARRAVFSTTQSEQCKDRYFLESGDKMRYFFEAGALNESGDLVVEKKFALNKVGHALHWLHPAFKEVTFSEKVKECCWQLGLADPVVIQSMYIFKNPGIGGEVRPHQDSTYLYTEPVEVVGFWIALQDATLENGCLWFAPGSHCGGVHRRFLRNSDNSSAELLVYNAPEPCYPTSNFRPTPVKKGACVLIHGQVVHQSEENKSKQSRHAYTFHVYDQKKAKYSSENWLQPTENFPFPSLYKN